MGYMQDYDNETATMLDKVNAPGVTKESLVQHYAEAILAPVHMDWDVVNDAIVHRWGDYALAYINKEAWIKIVDREV
jgi:hypothetical protein